MAQPYERIARRRRRALVVASAVLCGLSWIDWWFTRSTWLGLPYPVFVAVALAANVVVTARWSWFKRATVATFQKYLLNPVVRVLVRLGLPLGWSLIETTGRHSKQPRVVPVGHGLVDGQFWIIAEHGTDAGYVRNLRANPCVRVCLRHGWRMVWRTGTAHLLTAYDPYARQRWLIGWTHPLRALNAMIVRVLGTSPVTIRIDLDPAATIRQTRTRQPAAMRSAHPADPTPSSSPSSSALPRPMKASEPQ
jgi:deazaflavin-dependent oxidoreductase (nitroreductase family)